MDSGCLGLQLCCIRVKLIGSRFIVSSLLESPSAVLLNSYTEQKACNPLTSGMGSLLVSFSFLYRWWERKVVFPCWRDKNAFLHANLHSQILWVGLKPQSGCFYPWGNFMHWFLHSGFWTNWSLASKLCWEMLRSGEHL